jgi:beta-glucosidase
VVQVYVGEPSATVPRPVKELKDFSKVTLAPGINQHVSITLSDRSFSFWNESTHNWRMDRGAFDITVGDSSADDRLVSHIDLK